MRFKVSIFLCILISRLSYAQVCVPPSPLNACEISRSACSDEVKHYASLYGEFAAGDLYGTCPRNNVTEMADSIKNCSIPGLFITANLVKNIALRSLAGVVTIALVLDTLNESVKDSGKCFLDIPGKLKAIEEYNAKVEFSRNKVPFHIDQHKIHLPRQTVENMSCVRLAEHISYRNQLFEKEIAKNIKKVNPKDFDQIINFSSSEDQLKQNGVDLSCIRPSKKALIMCEIAAAGTGVGVLAASKLARQIAFAKAVARDPKRYWASRKELKLGTYIKDSVNFTNQEIAALKTKANDIFNADISEAQKISDVGRLYLEARLSKLPLGKQDTARSILKNVGTDTKSYYKAKEIFIEKGLDPSLIEYQLILGHEFEHAMQGLNDRNRKTILDAVKSFVGNEKAPSFETYGDYRYRTEVEAIGAQYDMLQVFPKSVVLAHAENVKGFRLVRSESGSIEMVHDADLLFAATKLPRDQYIATMRNDHGYHGLWAAKMDLEGLKKLKSSPIVSAAIMFPSLFALDQMGMIEPVKTKIREKVSPLLEKLEGQ